VGLFTECVYQQFVVSSQQEIYDFKEEEEGKKQKTLWYLSPFFL
jgi:hypothetical protein